MQHIFAADIGGTNSRFAHYELQGRKEPVLVNTVWLRTGEASSFEQLLEMLAASSFDLDPVHADVGVLAVAGAVDRGRFCKLTNASFALDLDQAGLNNCLLVNDFVAQAHASCTRDASELTCIRSGRQDFRGVRIAVGAGTGLGHCALIPNGSGGSSAFMHIPSEAGHMALPMIGKGENDFQKFAMERTGGPYLSGDAVVTGSGLRLLHFFLTGRDLPPREIALEIDETSATSAWFARFYGRACRQYALAMLARGGVWLCGGLAAQNPFLVTHPEFCREFDESPTYREMLKRIPLYLDTNRESGLLGSALLGRSLLEGANNDPLIFP